MVDLTAIGIGSAVPAVPENIPMSFGGFFDKILLGLPVYFWAILLLFAALVMVVIYAAYVWYNLGPVWGWFVALKKNQAMALKRNKNRRAKMVPIETVAHIFHDDESPEMWHQTSLEAAQYVGGVPMVDVCDWHDWVDDEIINEAIATAAEKWNENCKETGKLTVIDKKTNKEVTNLIFDYISFQKHLANGDLVGLMPNGIELPAFFYVDFSKVERYMPKERSASTFGGFITYYSNKISQDSSKTIWGMLLPIAAICGLVLITSIIAYMILKMAG